MGVKTDVGSAPVEIPADFRPEERQLSKAATGGEAKEQLRGRAERETTSVVTGHCTFHFLSRCILPSSAIFSRACVFPSSGEGRKKSCTITSVFKLNSLLHFSAQPIKSS